MAAHRAASEDLQAQVAAKTREMVDADIRGLLDGSESPDSVAERLSHTATRQIDDAFAELDRVRRRVDG